MENKKGNKIKYIVFGFFMASLFVPMLQTQFRFFKECTLQGFFDTETFPAFSDSLFKAGIFQEKFEKATTDNIGGHDFLVKFECQLNYNIFNISKAQNIVVGKNGYLYGTSYINAVNGQDFVGKEEIDINIQKAILVEKELKKRGVNLIFAFAPGKGSFYPEFIPDKFMQNVNPDSTNYGCYIKVLNKTSICVIDIKKYFLSIKDTSQNALFPKAGIHWSEYASVLAIDTISKYIANLRKIKLRHFAISGFEKKTLFKKGDYDAANLMNILSMFPHDELPYVKIKYSCDSTGVKPNLLTVADSYFSCIVATNIVDSLYSDWDYWLYRNRIPSDKNKPFNLKTEIEKRDVILLLATDATLTQYPFEFINEAYELYAPKDKNYYALKNKEFHLFVYQTFENIKKDKAWRNRLIKSAKERGVSETVEFFGAAVWCYNERFKK